MKNIVIAVLVMLLILIVGTTITAPSSLIGYNENADFKFETKTLAVCENQSDGYIYCRDELFVICGDDEYVMEQTPGEIDCNGVSLQVPLIAGFAVFDEDWEDPRLDYNVDFKE